MQIRPVINFIKGGAVIPASVPKIKVLLISQMLGTGTATSGNLYQDVTSSQDYETLFGKKSMVSECIRAFYEINKYTQLDVIPLADNAEGTAATGKFTISGTATEAGVLTFYVGDTLKHKYEISIPKTTTADNIGDMIVAAITADSNSLVSAVNTTGEVVLTFNHKGTIGNDTLLRVEGVVPGVSVVLAAFSGGATNPVITDVLNIPAISKKKYDFVAENYLTDTLDLFVKSRANINKNDLTGKAFVSFVDSKANLLLKGDNYNNPRLCIFGSQSVSLSDFIGSNNKTFPSVLATVTMAVRALLLTPGADISNIVANTSYANEIVGSMSKVSSPYFNNAIPNLDLVDVNTSWSDNDEDQLNDAGISIVGNNQADNGVIFGRLVTTYKTTSTGLEDTTFKSLNSVDEYDFSASYFFDSLRKFFIQTRLTVGDVVSNWDMTNETETIKKLISIYQEISGMRLVDGNYILFCSGGEKVLQYFRDNLNVSIVAKTGTINIRMQLVLLSQVENINLASTVTFSI